MGMFDFLKIIVADGKAKKPQAAKGAARSANCIEVDSKSYPLAALTPNGLVATGFDGSLIRGQNARIVVKIDDAYARFSFPATVSVADVKADKLVCEFQILPPELEQTLRKYSQIRKQKTGAR
ncbi:hypothetical protein [Azospirillum sp. ST 5-10]|uniref:hypothetical protein n=1 Tax=unclassified Azospirillum TaxID=2630922 RepID=UPI003F4A5BA4